MEMKTNYACLFLVVVIAAGLGLTAMSLRSAIGDEFGSIWMASQSSPAFIIQKAAQTDVHPPLPYLLLHAWGRLAGTSDPAMRIPSLIFVLLSLPVLRQILREWAPGLTPDQAALGMILCASAPILWVQAMTARYYALGTITGLIAVMTYLRWLRMRTPGTLALYAVTTGFLFYIHFFLSALVVFGQVTHYIIRARGNPRRAEAAWIGVQVAILLMAAPVVVCSIIPHLSGTDHTLFKCAVEGFSGLRAIPFILIGHLFTALTGGVPFPWDFWVTIPVGTTVLALLFRDLRNERVCLEAKAISFVIIPFVLLALGICFLVPVSGYFYGILRGGPVPVLGWILIGMMVGRIRSAPARHMAVAILLTGNFYSVALAGLDLFSMFQSTPVKAAADHIAGASTATQPVVVFHPFFYGWGDPLCRYLPSAITQPINDDCPVECVDPCRQLVSMDQYPRVWVIQRNRFSRNADELTGWLTTNSYRLSEQTPLQIQRNYDIWFKERIKSVRGLGYSANPSAPSYWLIRRYDRAELSAERTQ